MAPTDTIVRLVSFQGRWAGTDAERRAAEYLEGELRGMGRDAEIERIRVRPAYALTHALHAALAVAGNVISVYVPPLGVVILLLVAVSMFLDLTGRFHLLRRVMPRRWSQNVTSAGPRPDAPARLVITAHYDAARSGVLFNRRRTPLPLIRRLRTLAGPIDAVFWTVIVSLLLALGRLFAGFEADEGTPLTVAQFVATVPLLVAVLLFVDVALSDVVPGASDNASGVAAALELTRRLDDRPPESLDVWVVLTGAKEGSMLGMREWMRTHKDDIDPRRTFFLNIDSVGAGEVRWVRGEGFVILYQHDARLVALAESLARSTGLASPEPFIWRLGTDGALAPMHGFPGITICATDRWGRVPNFHRHSDTPDRVDPAVVERAIEYAEQIVRQIDARLIPEALPSLQGAQRSSAARRELD